MPSRLRAGRQTTGTNIMNILLVMKFDVEVRSKASAEGGFGGSVIFFFYKEILYVGLYTFFQ